MWHQERTPGGLWWELFCMCVLIGGHAKGRTGVATILCLRVGVPEAGGSASGLLRVFGLGRDPRSKCSLLRVKGLLCLSATAWPHPVSTSPLSVPSFLIALGYA